MILFGTEVTGSLTVLPRFGLLWGGQGELLADSREYVERLEEVRERLAGVGRGRKRVWREVRERVIENGELGD